MMDWSTRRAKTKSTIRTKVPFRTPDQVLIFFSLLLILGTVLIFPLGGLLFYSLAPTYPVTEEYYFTFEHYITLFSNFELLIDITVNTVIFGIGATVISLSIGLIAAIIEEKYFDQSPFRLLMVLPYGLPVVASLTGWVILLGRNGVITNLVKNIFHLSQVPYDIYTLWGMIFVEAIHTAPIAFILLSPAIRSMPAAIDEAALTAGASRITVFRKILIPLIAPSLISVAIYLFSRALASVVVPGALGLPKGIFTWGTAIPFLFLSGLTLNYSLALAFSIVMTGITGLMIIYYYHATSKAAKYTTVTGTGGGESKKYSTGIVKKGLMVAFFVVYLFVAGFLPLFTIIWNSLLPTFNFTFDLSVLTLEHYVVLFAGQAGSGLSIPWYRALRNTFLVGFIVPTIAMLVAFFVSYSNRTIDLPFAGLFAYLASAPLAVPGITVGLAFLIVYLRTPLYGTVILLIMAFVATEIPVGMRYSSPALTKIGKENIEAASVCGYKEFRSFAKIISPLTINDFIAGWMHIYVSTVRNVSVAILLYTAGSEVVAVLLFNELRAARFKSASTIAVVITILATIPYMSLQYWRIKRGIRR